MSGRLVGEVLDHTRQLRALGVPKRARDALLVIAEGCYDNRIGTAPLRRIGDVVGSERTASRALADLIALGLVIVLTRGGGRGRSQTAAVYGLAELDTWCAHRVATIQATQSAGDASSTRHPGGGSKPPDGDSIRDPLATLAPSTRHPGDDPPVVPVKDPLGTTEATTGPREHRPAAPPAGSRCGRRDCRAPGPCGACGRARRQARPTPAAMPTCSEHELAQRQAQRRREEHAAAVATCPNACADGWLYEGGMPSRCTHARPPAARPGRDRALAEAARLREVGRNRAGAHAAGRHRQPGPPPAYLDLEFARAAS